MTRRGKTRDLITAGVVVDLGDPPGSRWSIPAAEVREYCAGQVPGRGPDTPVRLRNALISEELDLSDLSLGRPLCFSACEFRKAVNLTGLRTTQEIVFEEGTSMWALLAEDLISTSDLVIKDCVVQEAAALGRARIGGALQLTGSTLSDVGLESARVGADLDCSATTIIALDLVCVNGKHLHVDGEIILTGGSCVDGEVDLRWAHARSLRATGTQLKNSGGCALRADGFHIADDIFLDDGFQAEGAVTLIGARVGDELRCTDGVFDNRGDATEANLRGRCLDAERVEANDVLLDRGFTAHGEVRLVGAQLETQLNCTSGTFHREDAEYALNADDLVAKGDVFLNETFLADGEVRLVGAEIGRELNCTGGHFRNPGKVALNADGMTTAGSVFLNRESRESGGRPYLPCLLCFDGETAEGVLRMPPRGFQSDGQVRFARATVGRQLDCVGGLFGAAASKEPALDLTGVVGKGDALLKNATVMGGVSLAGACIDRDLNYQNTTLSSSDSGPALHSVGLRVDGTLTWRPKSCLGAVNLGFARVGLLDDDLGRWPGSSGRGKPTEPAFSGGYDLTGFTYEELAEDPREGRENWLKGTSVFSPLPWHQLASYYRRTGRDQDARKIIISSHKESRDRAGLARWAKWWDLFVSVTTGFGYRLYLPFIYVLILWVIGIFAFRYAQDEGVMHATRSAGGGKTPIAGQCTAAYPCFVFWLYPLELLMPVLGLWLVGYWLPSPVDALGWLYLFISVFYIVAGWVLGIAVVAGIRHLLKAD